jgi:uncharacterized phage-associated protein
LPQASEIASVASRSRLSQQGFELGEDLLDRIEVGRVFRQEHETRPDGADRSSHCLPLWEPRLSRIRFGALFSSRPQISQIPVVSQFEKLIGRLRLAYTGWLRHIRRWKYYNHLLVFRRQLSEIVLWKITPATENHDAKGAGRPETAGRYGRSRDYGREDCDRRNGREIESAVWKGQVWKGRSEGACGKAIPGGTVGNRQEGGGRALGVASMASSITVANRILDCAEKSGASVTSMQLLKLVYIAHGWMLGLKGHPLIDDEIQAWKYGPVIPRLYNVVRKFRDNSITGRLDDRRGEQPSLTSTEDAVVCQTFKEYGNLNGIILSRMTHAEGTPWAITYDPDRPNKIIPNDLIEDHYQKLKARSAAA